MEELVKGLLRNVSSSVSRRAALALAIPALMVVTGGHTDARGGQRISARVVGENENRSVATWVPNQTCDAKQKGDHRRLDFQRVDDHSVRIRDQAIEPRESK